MEGRDRGVDYFVLRGWSVLGQQFCRRLYPFQMGDLAALGRPHGIALQPVWKTINKQS